MRLLICLIATNIEAPKPIKTHWEGFGMEEGHFRDRVLMLWLFLLIRNKFCEPALSFLVFVILLGCMANQFPVFPSHYRQFAWADAPVLSTMVPPPVYPKPVKQWTRETERKKEETETHQYPPWYHLPRYILKTVNQWTSVWGPCHRHHLINPKHPRLSNRGRSDQEISKLQIFMDQRFCEKVEKFGRESVDQEKFIWEYFTLAHIWNVIIPADLPLEGWLQIPWAPKVMPAFEIMQIWTNGNPVSKFGQRDKNLICGCLLVGWNCPWVNIWFILVKIQRKAARKRIIFGFLFRS